MVVRIHLEQPIALSSNGRTSAFEAEDGGSSPPGATYAVLAQSVERPPEEREVVGANPTGGT